MGGISGNYSRGGDPAAMFDEENLYLDMMPQAGKPAVDSDFNDAALMRIHARRRIIEHGVGDGSPNNGFKIEQSLSPANNFVVRGGDGSADGAGRLFYKGWSCVLAADVEYSAAYDARMRRIHPQVTAITPLTLEDSTANWTVNEHAGKTLTPNVENPGTTFTILSNTATVLTVSAGDLTAATDVRKHYRIELSTPSGGARVDRVYLDIFLDEADEFEDTNLVHPAGINASANRWVLRQFVRVREGAAIPAPHVDADGRQHYVVQIATLNRLDGVANVLAAQIDDDRPLLTGGGSSLTVEELDGVPSISPVSKIKVPPGALTDLGGGEVLIQTGAGGGGVSTGLISKLAPWSLDISGVGAPGQVVLGTDVDAQRHPHGAITGQRVTFQVPEDYDSGPIELLVVYAMEAAFAAPNNVIRVSTQAKIVDADGGAIDAASYPETQADHVVPDNSTDFVREVVLTIAEGDFTQGDFIQAYVKRHGNHANDVAVTGWDVVAYIWRYTGQIATRATTQAPAFWQNAVGENPTVGGLIGTDIDTEDFPAGSDSGQKVVFHVPDNWDEFTEAVLRLNYAMASAAAGQTVRLETYGEIVDVVTGAITPLPPVQFDLSPPNNTDPQRSVAIRMIPSNLMHKGDTITLVLARRTVGVPSNHPGDMQAISLFNTMGISPASGFSIPVLEEKYLDGPMFGTPTDPAIQPTPIYPTFGGDFDALWSVNNGGGVAGQQDTAFHGRLSANQTKITRVKVALRGTGDYQIRVYVEGSGAVPVYSSGVLAAPGGLTEVMLTDLDLSGQPVGQKRYHVVVEAHVDPAESILFSRPFVRQE